MTTECDRRDGRQAWSLHSAGRPNTEQPCVGKFGRSGLVHAFVGDCEQLFYPRAELRGRFLGCAPLLPQAAVGQERGGVVGAERGVDVEQGAEGPVLVVALIRLREVGGQVTARRLASAGVANRASARQ